tara:strand:+ start:1973 stop:5002 length:3030 start_codon:yes stop_codon:yes gene_type:complete
MINIELLDYKYDDFSNNQVNFSLATTNQGWTVVSQTKISISTTAASTSLYPVTGDLAEGSEYEISLTLSNKTGTGDIGFSTWGSDSSNNGIPITMRRSTSGSVSGSFTAVGVQGARILAETGTAGDLIATITQKGGINWNESVAGSLDVGDSEDFPLAMSFSVSEARNLNSRTGTYSKTFKIPATKNNNKILKYSYNEGYHLNTNTISNQKQCRITVDGNLSIVGTLQVTAIGKATEPLYYSCVFYGNNVDWASSINNKLLKDLSVNSIEDGSGWDNLNGKGANTGVGLKVIYEDIKATWDVDDAVYETPFGGSQTTSTSPIVYPLVGYGENNQGGAEGAIQLLKTASQSTGYNPAKIGYFGFFNDGSDYPTPIPSMDWRPAIFIYDIVKQLFRQEGYSISSTFIETAMFKGITMLLPNFKYNNVDERISDNSLYGSFESTGYVGDYSFLTGSSTPTIDYYIKEPIKWDTGSSFNSLNTDVTYSNTGGEFTIAEFGFYDITMANIGGWLDSVCEGASTGLISNDVGYIQIRCQIQTAGQTSWVTIDYADGFPTTSYSSCPNPPAAEKSFDFENLDIQNRWLNKNDKIRFQLTCKASFYSTNTGTIGWDIFLYGGTAVTGIPPTGTSGANGLISIVQAGENVEYGQTFDLKNVIDSESSQLGFLQGIIHAFNLQFTTDNVSKVVYIEPFNDFYKNQNEAIDWTHKVDQSRTQEDKWIQSDLRREVIFKYKTDSNDKVVEHRGNTYWNGILDEFPYREFLSNEFEVGKSIFENPFFAGSYNSQDGQTYSGSQSTNQTPYRSNLWGLCDTGAVPTGGSGCRPPKGYNFLPRLVNYVKSSNLASGSAGMPAGFPIRFAAKVQVWGLNDFMVMIPGYSSPTSTPILAYANSIDAFTFAGNPRQPLSYRSVEQGTYDFTNNSIGSPTPYKGLYQKYYQQMMEQIKSNPRVKTVYVNLKLSDINNLDLRKLVYIEGYYYRINRIIDYKPNNNEVTKVEVILWEEKGNFPIDTSWNS